MMGGLFFLLIGVLDISICIDQIIKSYRILYSGEKEYLIGTRFTFPIYKKILGSDNKKFLRMEKNYFQNSMKKYATVILFTYPIALLLGFPFVYLGARIIIELSF